MGQEKDSEEGWRERGEVECGVGESDTWKWIPPFNVSLTTDTTPTLKQYTQDAIQLFSRPQVYVMDNAT